jgi:hypothetical protein
MQHILLQWAEELKNAKGLPEAQYAFELISDVFCPFFKAWPNQLKRNEMKLYRCKKDVYCWLQQQNLSPSCPYAITRTCLDMEEVGNGE